MTRRELESELERLLPSAQLRRHYFGLDDARLAAAIGRMQETEQTVARIGHVAAANRDARTTGVK